MTLSDLNSPISWGLARCLCRHLDRGGAGTFANVP